MRLFHIHPWVNYFIKAPVGQAKLSKDGEIIKIYQVKTKSENKIIIGNSYHPTR
jgi:hypothetical protein